MSEVFELLKNDLYNIFKTKIPLNLLKETQNWRTSISLKLKDIFLPRSLLDVQYFRIFSLVKTGNGVTGFPSSRS